MDEFVLQSIIGTDKKNPLLSVCRVQYTKELQIYFGTQLLETIPSDRKHINFRAAVGRLYNAGLSRKKLQEVFKVDRKTMQRWGQALLMKDGEEAVRILSGRGRQKITIEIRRFIEVRYSFIYERNRCSYNKEIREEVLAAYDLDLSSESVRKVIKLYKQRLASEGKEREEFLGLSDTTEDSEDDDEEEDNHIREPQGDASISNKSSNLGIPTMAPSGESTLIHIHHAGILIFSYWIQKIDTLLTDSRRILSQWLCAILLEKVNIEQTKFLDFNSLSFILEKTYPSLFTQRELLDELSNTSLCANILRLNGKLTGVDKCDDYYYDPHTKHYTGMYKILKGWCPCIRFADKALHCDMIHTRDGMPVYINYFDNYYDLRERYKNVISSFRHDVGIAIDRKISMVLDRGIFGIDVIQEAKNDPHIELITWEKGFTSKMKWDKSNSDGYFSIIRHHNSSHDIRRYQYYYHDELWDKDLDIRRIIVHAINPSGKSITVSILCTDLTRNPEEIIALMFNRWLQENDFKYLDKHFGINQITSYDTIKYSQLRDALDDKQVVNGEHKALTDERKKVENKLKNILHRKHVMEKNKKQAYEELKPIEKAIKKCDSVHTKKCQKECKQLKDLKRKRRQIKAKIGCWKKVNIDTKINTLDDKVATLNELIAYTGKNQSKLDVLIEKEFKRLDTRKKNLMDVIKIFARNIFYHTFEPFKKQYDNFRDDHDYFRNLSQADGFMKVEDGVVEIVLQPTAYLQPKTRSIINNVLNQINEKNPCLPDGSNRKLILKLIPKEGMKLAS
jgi:hypothetical protein